MLSAAVEHLKTTAVYTTAQVNPPLCVEVALQMLQAQSSMMEWSKIFDLASTATTVAVPAPTRPLPHNLSYGDAFTLVARTVLGTVEGVHSAVNEVRQQADAVVELGGQVVATTTPLPEMTTAKVRLELPALVILQLHMPRQKSQVFPQVAYAVFERQVAKLDRLTELQLENKESVPLFCAHGVGGQGGKLSQQVHRKRCGATGASVPEVRQLPVMVPRAHGCLGCTGAWVRSGASGALGCLGALGCAGVTTCMRCTNDSQVRQVRRSSAATSWSRRLRREAWRRCSLSANALRPIGKARREPCRG